MSGLEVKLFPLSREMRLSMTSAVLGSVFFAFANNVVARCIEIYMRFSQLRGEGRGWAL